MAGGRVGGVVRGRALRDEGETIAVDVGAEEAVQFFGRPVRGARPIDPEHDQLVHAVAQLTMTAEVRVADGQEHARRARRLRVAQPAQPLAEHRPVGHRGLIVRRRCDFESVDDRRAPYAEQFTPAAQPDGDPADRHRDRTRRPRPAGRPTRDLPVLRAGRLAEGVRRPGRIDHPARPRRPHRRHDRRPCQPRDLAVPGRRPASLPVRSAGRHLVVGQLRLVDVDVDLVGEDANVQRGAVRREPGLDPDRQQRDRDVAFQRRDLGLGRLSGRLLAKALHAAVPLVPTLPGLGARRRELRDALRLGVHRWRGRPGRDQPLPLGLGGRQTVVGGLQAVGKLALLGTGTFERLQFEPGRHLRCLPPRDVARGRPPGPGAGRARPRSRRHAPAAPGRPPRWRPA